MKDKTVKLSETRTQRDPKGVAVGEILSEEKTPIATAFGMPKQSLILIIILAVITIILLVTAIVTLPTSKTPVKTQPAKKAVIKVNRQTVLSFSSPIIISSSSASMADIEITTGVNKITAVQLKLGFDPKVLGNVTITPGTFFSDPVSLYKKIDPVKGTISFAFGIGLGQKPVTGHGTLATVSFTPIAGQTKPTSITFLPTTIVAAQGEILSALKSSSGISFSVK